MHLQWFPIVLLAAEWWSHILNLAHTKHQVCKL